MIFVFFLHPTFLVTCDIDSLFRVKMLQDLATCSSMEMIDVEDYCRLLQLSKVKIGKYIWDTTT